MRAPRNRAFQKDRRADVNDECDHEWVLWSGASRCRKCGTTQ
ncbi:hypothetical protein [Streptomyces sp. AV19]|nr:hypothetical protein [Streptomyces sp. AV19]MDG4536561.1 hypothetical protein [Streptomyces sp. AV19]